MKYNRSEIMKAAWKFIKEQGMTRSAALRLAWAQAKVKKEGKNMKESVIKKLIEMGASRWTKGEHDRLYLNNAAHKLAGFEILGIHKSSGRISYAKLNGEEISNSHATDISSWLKGVYIDIATGELHNLGGKGYPTIERFREALADLIAAN